MSEIKSFSDYTSKYNSNVDYSALFGGTSDSSSVGNTNMLSDYAAIKNGSYGKLMKAYYAKQDAEKLSGKGDTSQKLTLMKTSADSLKKSADALNDASLWEKKKIKKKDEKTGEETEVEDYDWDAITKKVKSFIDDYNDVVKEAWSLSTKASLQVRDAVGGGNTVNTISRSILTPPTYRLYYEDGTPAPGEGISSFRSRLHEIYYKTNYDDTSVYRTTFQLGAIWNILPGLVLKPTAYYFGTEGIENYFQADNETTGNTIRPASAKHNYDRHLQGDLVLSYDKKIKEHNIGAVAGASYTHDYSYRLSASGSGSSIDLIPTLNATADSTQRASSTKTMEATLSYFGRVNYDYKGKYIVSVSMRADGSSRFAEDNKWGFFPGVSAGWNMHRENFFKPLESIMSRWKWRASWGRTGNNNLSVANSRGEYKITDTNYQGAVGILNTTLKKSQ